MSNRGQWRIQDKGESCFRVIVHALRLDWAWTVAAHSADEAREKAIAMRSDVEISVVDVEALHPVAVHQGELSESIRQVGRLDVARARATA